MKHVKHIRTDYASKHWLLYLSITIYCTILWEWWKLQTLNAGIHQANSVLSSRSSRGHIQNTFVSAPLQLDFMPSHHMLHVLCRLNTWMRFISPDCQVHLTTLAWHWSFNPQSLAKIIKRVCIDSNSVRTIPLTARANKHNLLSANLLCSSFKTRK